MGTTVEFSPRGAFEPLTDMVGGGPFRLQAGQWTDDTSMALCLAESLIRCQGFDAKDQMGRYANWYQWGYLSATGHCFDIGVTTRLALDRYLDCGDPWMGDDDPMTAGNGPLMRLAPVAMAYAHDDLLRPRMCADSARTTHAASECLQASALLGEALARALRGAPRSEVLNLADVPAQSPALRSVADGAYLAKPRDQIRGTGYVVQSLEAALWCYATHDSFEAVVLAAANLGDDADTTAAIAGQLAGATWGMTSTPPHWLERLHLRDDIRDMADGLCSLSMRLGAPAHHPAHLGDLGEVPVGESRAGRRVGG